MNDREIIEFIKKRINQPVPNYLTEDFDWLLYKIEQLEELQEKTSNNLRKCRCKLADIKIILNL
jgi:hypothetical protein